jgi:hypothetical protein
MKLSEELIAWKDFRVFMHHESLKSYIVGVWSIELIFEYPESVTDFIQALLLFIKV